MALRAYRVCRETLEQPVLPAGTLMEMGHAMRQQKISTSIRYVMRLIVKERTGQSVRKGRRDRKGLSG